MKSCLPVAIACFSALLGLLPGQSAAADISAGQARATAVCGACHGAEGRAPIDASYPILSGQHRDYLERALMDYKSGARKNAIMAAQAQGLSPRDIENLAAYYARLEGPLRVKP